MKNKISKIFELRRFNWFFIFYFLFLVFNGCVYYNTFYNARLYYQQGVKLMKTNPTSAKTSFEKSIAKSAIVVKKHFHSKWADDALYLVAMSYYYLGEYDKAIKNFEDLSVAFPNSSYRDQANYYQGLAYLGNKDYGSASVIFYELEENSPKFASAAAFQIAQSFFQKEEYELARDSLIAFIQRFPKAKEHQEATLILAESYFKLKNWSEATRRYRDYIKQGGIEPKERAATDLQIAECLLQEQKYDSTRIILSKDYSYYRDLVNQVNLLLGKALLAEKKNEAATKYLTQIKTGEQAAEAYFLLGKKHEEAKEFEMAIAYYDTASRLAPNSEFGISAKKHLSLLNLLQEKNTGAKNPAETHFLLGEIYGLALNDNEAALREYRITYDSFPESPYALKALYAQAWIIKNRLHREDYDTIFKTIINEYPRTIYANVARRSLGLPEIKLLPEDTASPKPLTESIPSPTGPKPESLALTKKELPTVPKESLPEITVRTPSPEAESIMQQRAPTKPRGRHRRTEIVSSETTKIANLQPPKESLPSSFKPKPESLLTSKSESVSAKNESLPQPVESTAQKEAKIKSTSPTAGKFIFLPIHFDFDRYNIRTGDAGILKTIAQQLQQDSTVKILIEGHCDPIGGEKYNYTLGLRRANSAREYLIKLGISKDRISTISYGKDKPLTNDSSEYWKNRRCEFVIKNEPS